MIEIGGDGGAGDGTGAPQVEIPAQPTLPEGTTVEQRLGPAGAASGDPDRLQQVLLNLVDNAVKYSGNHATVRVSTERAGDRVQIARQACGREGGEAGAHHVSPLPLRRIRTIVPAPTKSTAIAIGATQPGRPPEPDPLASPGPPDATSPTSPAARVRPGPWLGLPVSPAFDGFAWCCFP